MNGAYKAQKQGIKTEHNIENANAIKGISFIIY
jgi:hypothetical protein